jgi:hypothetical protein
MVLFLFTIPAEAGEKCQTENKCAVMCEQLKAAANGAGCGWRIILITMLYKH